MEPGKGLGSGSNEFSDEDLVPISALEHLSYCPRQCALIHREQTFDENIYTMRGKANHERVDRSERVAVEDGMRVERSLPLWSSRLGLIGKADVVEFHGDTPYPVEYKSGPLSLARHAQLQLCAQAICLEEMLGKAIPRGAIFHAASKRRREVELTAQLRDAVVAATHAVRELLKQDRLPHPVADKRCPSCSLIDSCYPYVIAGRARASRIKAALFTPKGKELP